MQNESFPFRMHKAPQKKKDRDICDMILLK